jgi:ubiquinone/menaquinone biosynthesis C-methylase UbiE
VKLWRDQALPRLVDLAMRGDSISEWRRRCLDGVRGVVVEPGFGSGLNLPHLPSEVTKVYAVDPAVVGRGLAADRIASSGIEVEFVGLDGQAIPLGDETCDAGVLTYTLCSVPDPRLGLAELRRVIKRNGTLHFVEHGEAPDERVHRWQRRVTPIQRRVAAGCHLDRPITRLIAEAGFDIRWTEARYHGRPKVGTYFTAGVALNA